ncbi:hypothetical protein [Kutzneria sp. CA-103260]|uniref:hypothetical protein n=1 Tax=Kutzneria sp. CA-103260 TaxID=2802641 RepID=UPI001BADB2E7|nr:hypothetical protein [Kutzneria sp. CA-103260]QUQ62685.1 hypothetical protein JJ691_03970 [Kutzneria sp. CA-103260]
MAKVNHRDTLDTSLRELQRRLRLLEARHAALAATTNAVPAFAAATDTAAVAQFVPSRPVDWWQLTDAADWTDLATATIPATAATVRLWADGPGDVRVQVDGRPDTEFSAGQHVIAVTGGTVRIQGRGTIQAFATLS